VIVGTASPLPSTFSGSDLQVGSHEVGPDATFDPPQVGVGTEEVVLGPCNTASMADFLASCSP